MKTKDELNTLKEEVETLSKKLAELTAEELDQISGGIAPGRAYWTGRKTTGDVDKNASSDSADS